MKKKYIIVLLVILVIGFASISTTLVIRGFTKLAVNLDDFDVIFIDAKLNGEYSSNAVISEDKKKINFTTDKFINIGDSAILDYKVKNTSTQYDADVLINCTTDAGEYIDIASSFDGNEIPLSSPVNMKAQEIKSGYVDVSLAKAYAGEDKNVFITCELIMTGTSRETYQYSISFDSNGGSSVDDKTVILDNSYGKLESPKKEGYTFLGWYDEKNVIVDENTVLDTKGNRILYAKWKVNEYPVNIKTNGYGTSETSSINILYDGTKDIKVTSNGNYYLSSIDCTDGYAVENFNPKTPIYKEQSVTIRNNKKADVGECTFNFKKGIFEYNYTGSGQEFSVPLNGKYKFEVYGAGGNNSVNGGAGSSTSGSKVIATTSLKQNTLLYVYIGQKEGAFNGGGSGGRTLNGVATSTRGSGASDIRLIKASNGSWYDTGHSSWNTDASLLSRIITAGGGAGAKVTAGRSFNGATPTNNYYNSSYLLYGAYPRDGEGSNGTLGLGSSEATGTSRLTDTGDIGNGASGGGGGGWYGGSTSAGSHNYTYAQFTNIMRQNASGVTGGILGINGNRLAGTEVHSRSGTSYINNGYTYNNKTYTFTGTSIAQQQRNGHGYAKITLLSID